MEKSKFSKYCPLSYNKLDPPSASTKIICKYIWFLTKIFMNIIYILSMIKLVLVQIIAFSEKNIIQTNDDSNAMM